MREIEIPLSQGKFTLIDVDDLHLILPYRWCILSAVGQLYAARRGSILMHRVIMAAPPDMDVDHVNGNGLDNRRSNLRLATSSENGANRTRLNKNNVSGVTGVYWRKDTGKWQARVQVEWKTLYSGCFETIEEATAARDEAAQRLHGSFFSPGRPK